MGNSCGCDLSCKTSNMWNAEFSFKPTKASLIGRSKVEEEFIINNTNFHNKVFPIFVIKPKTKPRPQSASADLRHSRLADSEKPSMYRSVHTHLKEADNDEIIYEGELEKYTPEMAQKFISRWCRLTTSGFAYYKNQWSATCFMKPLKFIPLSLIKNIKVIKNRIQKKILKILNSKFA